MSDNEVTPLERGALGPRGVRGVRRIRPLHAHRAAWIAATLAAVLVAGIVTGAVLVTRTPAPIAATPDPTSTSAPASAPTASPTSTPDPGVATIVPFDGDCSRALDQTQADAAVGGTATLSVPSALASVTPDLEASATLLGGLICSWSEPGSFRSLLLAIFPIDVVPSDLVTDQIGECDGVDGCTFTVVAHGMWISAGVGALSSTPTTSYEDVVAEARDRATTALAVVATAPTDELVGTAGSRDLAWRDLGCADVEDAIVVGSGMTSPQPGYPSDVYPSGPVWSTLVANGVALSCDFSSADGTLSAVVVQPGLSVPTDQQLAAAEASETTVDGAGRAWSVTGRGDFPRVVAQAAGGRVTAAGTSPDRVAAAVIAALGGR